MSVNYQRLIQQFAGQKILILGELMLDVYLSGTSNRLCREAPVPIVNIQQRQDMPGGAANAAVNMAVLSAQPLFLSVTGQDREADIASGLLKKVGVETRGIVFDETRETLTKKRVLSDEQLIVRYDYGSTGPISPDCERELITKLNEVHNSVDAVLVSDYGYGVLTDNVIAALKRLQKNTPRLLIVDAKNLLRYRSLHPYAVKPNYGEAIQLLELKKEANGKRVDQIIEHGQELLDITGAHIVCVTIDSEGAVVFERDKTPFRTWAQAVPNSQAAGAGDTYVSVLTIALSLKLPLAMASELASAAANVVVHKQATATCSASDLMGYFAPSKKIITDYQALAERVRAYQEQGRKVVFTNGCFDILHRGHITYLAHAKSRGDVLIVGVNSDSSVRNLKGRERPINSLEDRMQILAALDCVDHVVSFNDSTPIDLIKIVKPSLYVKGGDYTKDKLPEAPIVEEMGGQVEILPYVPDLSTTAVINKIHAVSQSA